MHIYAIINKKYIERFKGKLKSVFCFSTIKPKKVCSETYWKDSEFETVSIKYKLSDNFSLSLQEWQRLINLLSEGEIVTNIFDDEVRIDIYFSLPEMTVEPSLCFITTRIPISHCRI